MHHRRIVLAFLAFAAWLAGPPSHAQTIRIIDPIANPGFEDAASSTAGAAVLGSYWSHAEDKVIPSGEPSPPNGHGLVLRLASPGEFVQQRIPAYEYVAQGAGAHEGGSALTTISGEILATNSNVEARVILEESRQKANAGSWGFYQTAVPGFPGGGLGADWLYFSRGVATGSVAPMNWISSPILPYLGHYESSQDPGAQISQHRQVATPAAIPMRVYKAPQAGRLLVQCRIAWDRKASAPAAGTSDVRARIRVYDAESTMVFVQDVLPETAIAPGDGLDIGRQVTVAAGNLIAFETIEHLSPAIRPTLLFDPFVGYEPLRQVVYRFGRGLSPIASTPTTFYAPPIDIPLANTWQPFTLPAGQDYAAWFSQFGFAHGPVPQLAVRLEYVATTVPGSLVAFDNVHAPTGFRGATEAELSAEIQGEMDRIIGNHLQYGVGQVSGGGLNLHVRNSFNTATGVQTIKPLGGHDSLSELVRAYSTQFFHPFATPWLLRQADSIVAGRDPELGIARKYQFSSSNYVDPVSCANPLPCEPTPPCPLVLVGHDVHYFVGLYDLTHDVTLLDMAYRLGEILFSTGASATSPLYQGSFFYTLPGGVPTLVKQYSDTCFDGNHLAWAGSLLTLALLGDRTADHPLRYPLNDEFRDAAADIATWMHGQVAAAPGLYGAYWMQIDNALDDVFGHKAFSTSAAHAFLPDPAFATFLSQGATHFQPEWVQALARGTSGAADQERAWDAWRVHFEQNTVTNLAYGKAYVDATLNTVRTGQLGNGVWAGVSAAPFQQPDLGALYGTPVTVADGHKFRPVSSAYGDVDLASAALVTPALKADLLAYYATMFRMNALHFGNYLEWAGVTTNQLGYMHGSAYPDPVPGQQGDAGLEFRALSSAHEMLALLEPALPNQRPTVSIAPSNFGYTAPTTLATQTFTCTDPDGVAEFGPGGFIWIEATVYQDELPIFSTTLFPITDPAFTKQIVSPTTVVFTWAPSTLPVLYPGYEYRFRLFAFDPDLRWAADSALYEIP
jgi:hypothetical protein